MLHKFRNAKCGATVGIENGLHLGFQEQISTGLTASASPILDEYDRVIVAFSGGKDSLACLLHLIDQGVDRSKLSLHHNLVDGRESTLMDWPVTEAYCEAIAKAFGIPINYSYRVGGIEREMLRQDSATAPVSIPTSTGVNRVLGGNGPLGTRRKFPQVSASLQSRWCSSAGKIDVFDRYLNNEEMFLDGKTLVVTGERAQESRSRANYKQFEPHRTDNRNGTKVKRHVDHWRPVHAWTEHQVWDIIKAHRVNPHVSYLLGWSRASCRACIFSGRNQWATLREIAPQQFNTIAAYEREFKVTIHRKMSVVAQADAGTPFECDPFWVEVANSREFNAPVFVDPWILPPGAFGESCGPT